MLNNKNINKTLALLVALMTVAPMTAAQDPSGNASAPTPSASSPAASQPSMPTSQPNSAEGSTTAEKEASSKPESPSSSTDAAPPSAPSSVPAASGSEEKGSTANQSQPEVPSSSESEGESSAAAAQPKAVVYEAVVPTFAELFEGDKLKADCVDKVKEAFKAANLNADKIKADMTVGDFTGELSGQCERLQALQAANAEEGESKGKFTALSQFLTGKEDGLKIVEASAAPAPVVDQTSPKGSESSAPSQTGKEGASGSGSSTASSDATNAQTPKKDDVTTVNKDAGNGADANKDKDAGNTAGEKTDDAVLPPKTQVTDGNNTDVTNGNGTGNTGVSGDTGNTGGNGTGSGSANQYKRDVVKAVTDLTEDKVKTCRGAHKLLKKGQDGKPVFRDDLKAKDCIEFIDINPELVAKEITTNKALFDELKNNLGDYKNLALTFDAEDKPVFAELGYVQRGKNFWNGATKTKRGLVVGIPAAAAVFVAAAAVVAFVPQVNKMVTDLFAKAFGSSNASATGDASSTTEEA